jgi:hypothetical protein
MLDTSVSSSTAIEGVHITVSRTARPTKRSGKATSARRVSGGSRR